MKKLSLLSGMILAILFVTTSSQAVTIGFNPISQLVLVGRPANVDLEIYGLGNGVAPSLSTFDLNVGFDPTILALSTVTFGNQLNILGLGSVRSYTPSAGIVNLLELSLDLPDDLNSLQADSFVLADLVFNTLGAGTSPLSISINDLGDALGNPLPAQVQSGTISAVPVPGTWLLLLSGWVGIEYLRKRLFRQPASL